MIQKKTLALLLSFIFLVSSFSNPILNFSLSLGSDRNDSDSINQLTNNQPQRNKLSSEEENIDSMDVNPKSGRWSVSDNGEIDDRIIDSNLRVITSENTTDESSEYFAQRGLRDSDGKVESRHKSSFNASTNDFATTILGDAWDFEEGDQEGWITSSNADLSVANGILTVSRTPSDLIFGIKLSGLPVLLNTQSYTNLKIIIKNNNETTTDFRYRFAYNNGTTFTDTIISTLSNDWTVFNIDLTAIPEWQNSLTDLLFFWATAGNSEILIEEIQLIGSTDYATNVEGEIEDTWDFDDSLEYFYDVEGINMNFENSDSYVWELETTSGADSIEFVNNVINVSESDLSSNIFFDIQNNNSISIDPSVYNWFTFEFFSNVYIDSIAIQKENATSLYPVCTDSTEWVANQWQLFSCNLALDSDWNEENIIEINILPSTNVSSGAGYFLYNIIYLYDSEFGDVEGFTFANPIAYVKPEGQLFIRADGVDGVNEESLNVNADFFDTMTLRIWADRTIASLIIKSFSGATQYFITTLSSGWNLINTDQLTNWEGIISDIQIRIPIESILLIDYWLFTNNETNALEDQSFTMGLWDQDNSQSLVNISQRYFNSSLFRWEVELYDESSTISASYYSSNQTYSDIYYLSKISYNILETEFALDIRDQNGSRILKIDYPDDFTLISLPSLFEHQIAPDVFFSTYTSFFGVSTIWLDYINTKFQERQWKQTDIPTDAGWLSDSWNSISVDNVSAEETSTWELTVPYLDSFSGKVLLNTNNSGLDTADIIMFTMNIYSIAPGNGSKFIVGTFSIITGQCSGGFCTGIIDNVPMAFLQAGANIFYANATGQNPTFNPKLTFSYQLSDERNTLSSQFRFFPDQLNETSFIDALGSVDLTTILDFKSQEFVIETKYRIVGAPFDTQGQVLIDDFNFLSREIFTGTQMPNIEITDPIGTIINIVTAIGNFLASIFKSVMEVVSVAIVAAVVTLQPFLTAIKTSVDSLKGVADNVLIALGLVVAAVDLVTVAVNLVKDAVDFVTVAVGLVVDELIDSNLFLSAIELVLDDILEYFEDVLDLVIDDILAWLNAFLVSLLSWIFDDLWNEFLNLIFFLWEAFWTIIVPADLKDFLFGVSIDDLNDLITDTINLVEWIISQLFWVFIAFVLIGWTIPMMRGEDPFDALRGVYEANTATFETPNILGFRTSIPLGLIIGLFLMLYVATGDIPPIYLPF